jgi:hypothetical protein
MTQAEDQHPPLPLPLGQMSTDRLGSHLSPTASLKEASLLPLFPNPKLVAEQNQTQAAGVPAAHHLPPSSKA